MIRVGCGILLGVLAVILWGTTGWAADIESTTIADNQVSVVLTVTASTITAIKVRNLTARDAFFSTNLAGLTRIVTIPARTMTTKIMTIVSTSDLAALTIRLSQ